MVKQIRRVGGVVLLAAVGVVLGVVLLRALAGPSFIDEVTIDNPTDYSVNVRASGGDDSWLGLGRVGRGEAHTFHEVIDQGDTWVLEFSYAGEVAGHVTIDRDTLADAGWRVEVPASVGLHLAAQGFAPSPAGF